MPALSEAAERGAAPEPVVVERCACVRSAACACAACIACVITGAAGAGLVLLGATAVAPVATLVSVAMASPFVGVVVWFGSGIVRSDLVIAFSWFSRCR